MSRGQSTQAFDTASNENATDFGNAQSAFGSTEDAIGNYNNQLAKFRIRQPLYSGRRIRPDHQHRPGQCIRRRRQFPRGRSAGASSAHGQNSAADAATAATGAQQNTRDLAGDLAAAQQKRIAGEAGYNQAALGATAVPIGANQALYGTSSNAADSVLGDETQAAKTPNFWDQVGSSVAGNLGQGGETVTMTDHQEDEASRLLQQIMSPAEAQSLVLPPPDHRR